MSKLLEVTDELALQNAEASRVTAEEVEFLLKAMPASIERIEREVWTELQRQDYRKLLEERNA